LTKPYSVRLENGDGPEVDRIAKEEKRKPAEVIRLLTHEALKARELKNLTNFTVKAKP
jgi:hypothetical protein